jgi:hypothetical protein
VDNFVNVDPDAEGIRKVEEQQKAERLAELREAASVASIKSKFQEPKIVSTSSSNKKSSATSSSSINNNGSSSSRSGSIPRKGVTVSPMAPPFSSSSSSSSSLIKTGEADDDNSGDSSSTVKSLHSKNDAGLAMAESKEETDGSDHHSSGRQSSSANANIALKIVGTSTRASTSAGDAAVADEAHAELRLLLETINESPAVRAILIARSPELAELIDGTTAGGEAGS